MSAGPRHVIRSKSTGAEAHGELVGHENAVARNDGGFRVEFAAKGAGDLDGLQTTLEGLGERAVDGALKTLLEVVQTDPRLSSSTPAVVITMLAAGLAGIRAPQHQHSQQPDNGNPCEVPEPGIERTRRVFQDAEC